MFCYNASIMAKYDGIETTQSPSFLKKVAEALRLDKLAKLLERDKIDSHDAFMEANPNGAPGKINRFLSNRKRIDVLLLNSPLSSLTFTSLIGGGLGNIVTIFKDYVVKAGLITSTPVVGLGGLRGHSSSLSDQFQVTSQRVGNLLADEIDSHIEEMKQAALLSAEDITNDNFVGPLPEALSSLRTQFKAGQLNKDALVLRCLEHNHIVFSKEHSKHILTETGFNNLKTAFVVPAAHNSAKNCTVHIACFKTAAAPAIATAPIAQIFVPGLRLDSV